MASNMMELMKSKFAAMSRDELSLTARGANDNIATGFMSLGMSSGNLQLMIAGNFVVQSCLKLGFCTQKLSAKQNWFMNELYPHNYQNMVETQSAAAVEPIKEEDYQLIGTFADKNRQISEAMFNLLMSAAYADGGLKTEVERRIDPLFGFLFAAQFADGGIESVPSPSVPRKKVTGLEARILDKLLTVDHMIPLQDIIDDFPGETKHAVKTALDHLVDQELVTYYYNIDPRVCKDPYRANVEREDVEIVLSDTNTAVLKGSDDTKVSQNSVVRDQQSKKQKRLEEFEKKLQTAKKQLSENAEKAALAEEEKRREAEEKQSYEKAFAAWQAKTEQVKSQRKKELANLRRKKEKELNKEYESNYADAQKTAKKGIKSAKEKKQSAEQTLASLGMFKFSEKKEQKALIAEAEREIEKAEKALAVAKDAYESFLAGMPEELDRYESAQTDDVETRFPLPKKPLKPAVVLREEQNAKLQKERMEAKKIKDSIIQSINPCKSYRSLEIKNLIPALNNDETLTRTIRLCNDLVNEGKLQKTTNQNEESYSLSQSIADDKIKENIVSAMERERYYRCAEIKALVPELTKTVGMQPTARLCNELVGDGVFEKAYDRQVVYFRLVKASHKAVSQISDNKDIKEEIIDALEPSKWYRCTEIKALSSSLAAGEGTQRTARLCNDMVSEGILEKTIENKVVYFRIVEKSNDVSNNEIVKSETSENNITRDNVDYEAENIVIMEKLIKALEPNRWYRCAEIKALVPELAKGEGTVRTARLCNDLVYYGLLKKTIENKVVYFSLAE